MGAIFKALFGWLMTNFIGRAMAGAGLAFAGNYAFGKFIDYFISKALMYLANVPMIGLLGIAGIDKAISILLTATMIKIYLSTTSAGIKVVSAKK